MCTYMLASADVAAGGRTGLLDGPDLSLDSCRSARGILAFLVGVDMVFGCCGVRLLPPYLALPFWCCESPPQAEYLQPLPASVACKQQSVSLC